MIIKKLIAAKVFLFEKNLLKNLCLNNFFLTFNPSKVISYL
ncbi:hypothetical protein RCH33_737 [Flavobacterium daejeonense]|nr:hypothetical protein RCH33_737 [Flavobacterium daejeonense]